MLLACFKGLAFFYRHLCSFHLNFWSSFLLSSELWGHIRHTAASIPTSTGSLSYIAGYNYKIQHSIFYDKVSWSPTERHNKHWPLLYLSTKLMLENGHIISHFCTSETSETCMHFFPDPLASPLAPPSGQNVSNYTSKCNSYSPKDEPVSAVRFLLPSCI